MELTGAKLGGRGVLMQGHSPVMYINESSSTVLLSDGATSNNFISDGPLRYIPFQPTTSRVIFVDENGCIREGIQHHELILSNSIPVEDDGEIPPHALDHMYAKKPREPGNEPVAKPKRRSKKRESRLEQYVLPDPAPQPPKINIIRQRLPNSAYKLASSRPKILQGASSPTKGSGTLGSSFPNTPSSPIKGGKSPGRALKKEDPALNQLPCCLNSALTDFESKNSLKSNSLGNGQKSGKEHFFPMKVPKTLVSSKSSHSTAILDDFQKQVGDTGYEEEMLFDFGIEEEDDVSQCALSPEEFNDVVFGNCGFSSGLEAYSNALSSTIPKASSSLRNSLVSSNVPFSPRLTKKTVKSNSLSSSISDDDDSNQIMVPMGNRRKSKEWELLEKEIKSEGEDQCSRESSGIEMQPCPGLSPEDDNDKHNLLMVAGYTDDIKPPVTADPEPVIPIERSDSNTVDNEFIIPTEEVPSDKRVDDTVFIKSQPVDPEPERIRRSSRTIRAPARLDDIQDELPHLKKKKRYSC